MCKTSTENTQANEEAKCGARLIDAHTHKHAHLNEQGLIQDTRLRSK